MAPELHPPTADHGDSSFSFSSSSAYVAGRQHSEHINVSSGTRGEHDENPPLLGSRSDSMASKTSMDLVEENEHAPRKGSLSAIDPNAAKHGDRALAIIGDERVSLTEEDVCMSNLHSEEWH